MTAKTVRVFAIVVLAAASFAASANTRLFSQQAAPAIEANLTNLDQAIRQGNFEQATRVQAQLIALIFAEIKAHPPQNFEPSGAVVPVAATVAGLLQQTEAIRQAVNKPDLILARDLAMQFSLKKVIDSSAAPPSAELAALENQSLGTSGFPRFLLLPKLAGAAFESGDLTKAGAYCAEALAASAKYREQLTGEAVHHCNIIQGRIRLANNDLTGASAYLLKAGQTKGSPALTTFGPNMALARDLLLRGERPSVVLYLSECAAFWKYDAGRLSSGGGGGGGAQMPDFGPNVKY